jgi:hypothetical protein
MQLKSLRGAWDHNVQEVASLAIVLHLCAVEPQILLVSTNFAGRDGL